jgi:hypothetical protein
VAALAALAVVGGVLAGCGQEPTTGGQSQAARPSSQPSAPSAGAAPAAGSPSGATTNARVINVTVRGGQVSGDTGRVEVPMNTPVSIQVTSDVADELHVHGYDKEAQIPAGGTGKVSFTADIPGVFEVELHGSEKQLLSLQVS